MKILIACEESQRVCIEMRKLGHEAYSCDLIECSGGHPEWHIIGDAVEVAYREHWDMMIAHPPCTRLTNSGVCWLSKPPKNAPSECSESEKNYWKTFSNDMKLLIMKRLLYEGATLYKLLRDAPINKKAIENPIMHKYAKELIKTGDRQIIQPHWFGEPMFKATGFELIGLPYLKRTHWMDIPKKGSEEYKEWSWVQYLSPGPDRAKLRSKTAPAVAKAMAEQWVGVKS